MTISQFAFLLLIILMTTLGFIFGYFYYKYKLKNIKDDITKRIVAVVNTSPASTEEKIDFLATVSHEFRTPLNAIIGFNQCLLMGMDGPISKPQEVSLKHIEKAALHLLTLINDVLDFAKAEAYKIVLEKSQENIVDLIKSCVDEVGPLARAKSIDINNKITQPELNISVDPMRIKQVLFNVLSNAIKFTDKGSITIKLTNFKHGIEIHIADTGIGLSADEITKIFKPFYQADQLISKKYGGTGLGLAISTRILDLHNGTLSVKSKKGVGSTFIIFLPKT